ncbi:MsnO8 family LLM class oxidoreductase [Arthrobacter burdickii]|uniref:MsnO8 family LLM class oxidoreductase n=1 Tax=Arthrobacter burdickii TaxID=3035920 RepID=A0ABT8JWA8_9MICC|nr:MsnO8 family LLM class oxidoreductase [Arthrobacter burdickii]MDN4609458.1 MsnO8 family LLM class oxidoreductase [Arthrobacter burdickii]
MSLPFDGLSILDRAQSRLGSSESDTLRRVGERAQRAERLGYRRFWVAEHHGVPGIAGSVPAVLAAAVAARTSTIRVGTGGIMLPNHQPLVVAEQAATLGALFDGRFDLGIGRSLGFTQAVRAALRTGKQDADRFEQDIAELLAFLGGTAPVPARPQDGGRTPVFVLATGQGVDITARSGLAVVLGGPALFRDRIPVLERYREQFRPSPWWDEPKVLVSVNVAVAGTTSQARHLLLPEARALAVSRTRGYFPPLEAVGDEPLSVREEGFVQESLATAVHGTPADVARQLTELQARTGADELLVSGGAFDLEGQARSDGLLAELAAA